MREAIFVALALLLLCQNSLAETYKTPKEVLDAYLKACQLGDLEAAELCYTRSSREVAKQDAEQGAPPPPEALKSAYERLKDVDFKSEQVNAKRAILWPGDESIPPMFLRVQDQEEGWRLDYHFMSRYIRVGEDGWSWRDQRVFQIWKKRE
jgi:hypothetical protein